MGSSLLARLAEFVLDHRRWVALALALAVSVSGLGLLRLQPDLSLTDFFGSDDPEREYFNRFKEFWGPDDDVLLIVVTAGGESVVTPPRLHRIEALVRDLENHPRVVSVYAITNALRTWGPATGEVRLRRVLDTLPAGEEATGPALARWRQELLERSPHVPVLLAADGTAAAVAVEFDASADDVLEVVPLVAELRSVVDGHRDLDGLRYSEAGIPAVRADFFSAFYSDQMLFLPLTMLLIGGALAAIFRSVHGVLIPLLAASMPTLLLLGVMGFAGEPLGIVNQTLLTLLPVMAVADSIHLLSRYHEEIDGSVAAGRAPGEAVRRSAIVETMSRVGPACVMTSLTTAIGFLSLAIARMPIVRDFGLYAALGILLSLIGSLLLVPLLLSWTAGGARAAGPGRARIDRLLGAVADGSVRRPGAVFAATALLIGLGLYLGSRVVIDSTFDLLQPEHPTTLANQVLDESLGGIAELSIDLVGPPLALREPRTLQALLGLEEWARSQPEVRAVASPASVVAVANRMRVGRREIPETAAEVGRLIGLVRVEKGVSDVVARDFHRGRLVIRTRDEGGIRFDAFAERVRVEMEHRLAGASVSAHRTGTCFVAYRGINNVTADLRDGLLITLVAIIVSFGLLFKSARVAFLCIVPNAIPLLFGYALVGALGWRLEPTAAMIFAVGLGLVNDDTIHLTTRFRDELRSGLDRGEALRRSVRSSGLAVGITSLILGGGFAINIFSSFPTTATIGALAATVVFSALLCDLFVLTALLGVFGGHGWWQR